MRLVQVIEHYIELKQAMGSRFHAEAVILRAFGKAVGDIAIEDVDLAQVGAYLNGHGPITRFWHCKYSTLRGFYRFAIARGYVSNAPLPTTVPKPEVEFTPYIYSTAELKRLLAVVETVDHPRAKLSPNTVRTLLLVLYGAALRLSEALKLASADVDLSARLLLIRDSKFYKTRWVPIGPQLTAVLSAYASQPPQRQFSQRIETPFFTTRTGEPLTVQHAERAFNRLREQAQVSLQRWWSLSASAA